MVQYRDIDTQRIQYGFDKILIFQQCLFRAAPVSDFRLQSSGCGCQFRGAFRNTAFQIVFCIPNRSFGLFESSDISAELGHRDYLTLGISDR